MKTVLVPGTSWPTEDDWPKPTPIVRLRPPRKKSVPVPPKLSEAVVINGKFMHPKQRLQEKKS